jgi:hypothetical protein|tara:strand:+ start:692 stop:910 length:219 start_codon:yes stop_codon:yes gene_type:complete
MNVEAVEKVVDEFISMLEMAPYIRPAGGSEDFIQSFIPFAIRVRDGEDKEGAWSCGGYEEAKRRVNTLDGIR